jgi:glyoxylase-like metal-dependent hydrolase (beta-lactamase superfamily II)
MARRNIGCGKLRELLPQAGYAPEDVDVVVITHGHPDHINGLWEDGEPAFRKARYVIGEREFEFWNKGENVPASRQANRELFVKLVPPLAHQATLINPGEEVAAGVRAVEAFGHSAGQMAYQLESEGRQLLLWADVTNHYVVSLQVPDWHVAVDDDKETAVATRRRILDMVATDGIAVVGHHMPFPSLGFVERAGTGYRWVPASYQFNL